MRNYIDKYSKGKNVLVLFVLTNLVYGFMLLVTIPKTMAFSSGMKILDMMPTGYDSEYIHLLFETLEESGRHAYLYNQLPVDMVYPFLFGLSYCLMLAYFLKKINKFHSFLFVLCLLPVLGGLADYLENIGIIMMLSSYPSISPAIMKLTSIFSVVKSISTTVFFLALIVVLLIFGIQWFKERATSSS